MLNPLTVGVCAGLNLTSFLNLLLNLAFFAVIKREFQNFLSLVLPLERLFLATVLVGLISQLNIYYVQLIFAVHAFSLPEKPVKGKKSEPTTPMSSQLPFRFLVIILLYAANFLLADWRSVLTGNLWFL